MTNGFGSESRALLNIQNGKRNNKTSITDDKSASPGTNRIAFIPRVASLAKLSDRTKSSIRSKSPILERLNEETKRIYDPPTYNSPMIGRDSPGTKYSNIVILGNPD